MSLIIGDCQRVYFHKDIFFEEANKKIKEYIWFYNIKDLNYDNIYKVSLKRLCYNYIIQNNFKIDNYQNEIEKFKKNIINYNYYLEYPHFKIE